MKSCYLFSWSIVTLKVFGEWSTPGFWGEGGGLYASQHGTNDDAERQFSSWLSSCDEVLDWDPAHTEEWSPADLAWFRRVYQEEGEISPGLLRSKLEKARASSATTAFKIIASEAREDRKPVPSMPVRETASPWVQEGVSLHYGDLEIRSITVTGALMEIGDAVQGEIMESENEAWPVCPIHGFGAHLKKTGDQVEWWCRPGSHLVRVIYRELRGERACQFPPPSAKSWNEVEADQKR